MALVAALASDVELYLLDEPSSGLDPLMEVVFQDVVRELRDAGRTVLLSSHILAEVEALCDRVTIIRAGRAAETGTFDELRHLTRTSVVVETARPLDALSGLPGVHDVSVDHTRAQFSVDTPELNRVLAQLVEFDVRSLTSSPPTLEELFMRHYGDVIETASADAELVGCAMTALSGTASADAAGAAARPVQALRVRARAGDRCGPGCWPRRPHSRTRRSSRRPRSSCALRRSGSSASRPGSASAPRC